MGRDPPQVHLGGSIRAFGRARPPQHRCAERMAHSNRVQIRVRRPPDDKKSEATNATTAATAKKTILSCSRTCSVRANLGLAIGGIRSQSNLHRRGFCGDGRKRVVQRAGAPVRLLRTSQAERVARGRRKSDAPQNAEEASCAWQLASPRRPSEEGAARREPRVFEITLSASSTGSACGRPADRTSCAPSCASRA